MKFAFYQIHYEILPVKLFIFTVMSLKGLFPIDNWHYNSHTILNEISEQDRQLLLLHARKEYFKKGEIIFREGALPVGIYYIELGKIKKYKVDNAGKEHIFYVANTGELIGYHALLADEPYPDATAALEDSVVSFIPKSDFLQTLDVSRELSRKLLKTLSHEFGVLINNLSVSAQKSVRERVAIVLIVLREKFKHEVGQDEPVSINIPRDVIANMAGTTRENIARMLSDFRKEEIIQISGRKIIITNIRQLVMVANCS